MKKKFFLLGLTIIAIVYLYAFPSQEENRIQSIVMINAAAFADEGGESGSSGGGSGNGCGGYRQWNTSGIFAAKKHFYDCQCILREGYKPKEDCLGGAN